MQRAILSSVLVLLFLGLLLFSTGVFQFILQVCTFAILVILMVVFLSSLMATKTPVITRYALLMGAEDSVEERAYTRKVTWLWCCFLGALFSVKLLGFAGVSLMEAAGLVELVFYIGSAILFAGEFYIRPLFLPKHKGSSFWSFVLQLGQISFKDIWLFDSKN
jgi:uncharacterized membrane protein